MSLLQGIKTSEEKHHEAESREELPERVLEAQCRIHLFHFGIARIGVFPELDSARPRL